MIFVMLAMASRWSSWRSYRIVPEESPTTTAFALTAGGLAAEPQVGQVSAVAARNRTSARRLTEGQRIESIAG
jgi:hypothetical protein